MTGVSELVVDAILAAARVAARVCVRVQGESTLSGVPESKTGDEPVTIADYAAQAILLHTIARVAPTHSILAEESSAHLRGQGEATRLRVRDLVADALGESLSFDAVCAHIDHAGTDAGHAWAIDPIDGTRGFIRRDQYCVAVALLHRGAPVLSVLACPNLAHDPASPTGPRGVLFHAIRGQGAFAAPLEGGAPRRIHVRDVTDPSAMRILASVETAHGDPALIDRVVRELHLGGLVRMDSQVKYGALARGDGEIYVRPRNRPDRRENVWDHAPGVLLVEEAGGKATDIDGKPLDFATGRKMLNNRGIVVSHGPAHAKLLEALKTAEGD